MATKKSYQALGIMNGTSIDAIDYAIIQADSSFKNFKFKKHKQFPIPKKIKEQLILAAKNEMNSYDLSQLNFDLGRLYGKHIKILKKSWNWDVIGLHGQTIHHEGKNSTLQIGHPAFIAKETKTPIVYDFRSNDVACRGEGAPFAPFFQKKLGTNFSNKTFAFHNLGGISNLTYFQGKHIKAFDTGPANILMDLWMQKKKKLSFDKNGQWAQKGLPDPLIVNKMLLHPFFNKKAPKSSGREDFHLDFIMKWGGKIFKKLSFPDQMACLAELSALSIAKAYKKEFKKLPEKIYFYGGGVYNSYLMSRIQYHLPQCEFATTDDMGWPSQGFEASVFAFLGLAKLLGKKVHLPEVTGANKTCHLGSLYCL